MHPDGFFTNAISLEGLAQQVLDRMKLFPREIAVFNEQYHVQQAPASTFQVLILDGLIHILAVSVRDPTYYDFCVGDVVCQSSCYDARQTFNGMEHSGDCNSGNVLLQYITLTSDLDETSRTVFVSGYHNHALHKYKKRNSLVLVADHSNKTFYIVPIPLDTATIGHDATIYCPLVIRKNASNNTLLCSLLPTPTIEISVYCSGAVTSSTAFSLSIMHGDRLLEHPQRSIESLPQVAPAIKARHVEIDPKEAHVNDRDIIIATNFAQITNLERYKSIDPRDMRPSPTSHAAPPHIIRFGKGIHWISEDQLEPAGPDTSSSILPYILGGIMQGPVPLAIGEPPMGAVVTRTSELLEYYEKARSIVVLVDESMTDNARNIATTWRLNGIFILQTRQADIPDDDVDVAPIINNLKVNAITALAGPQSLVLVQLGVKHFFYRGIANPDVIDTPALRFGQEITNFVLTHGLKDLAERIHSSSWQRLVDLTKNISVYLPKMKQTIDRQFIKETFEKVSIDDLVTSKLDIAMMIPQLQVLLPRNRLFEMCQKPIKLVLEEVSDLISPVRQDHKISLCS